MEAAVKIGRQYQAKEKSDPEPTRRLFIARERSYHGATLGALDVSGHYDRKEIYGPILPNNTIFIPPCNSYRDMKPGETEQQYVSRLAEILNQKILDLGPENVAGFFAEPIVGAVSATDLLAMRFGSTLLHCCCRDVLSFPHIVSAVMLRV